MALESLLEDKKKMKKTRKELIKLIEKASDEEFVEIAQVLLEHARKVTGGDE